jgi:hypothetical protein
MLNFENMRAIARRFYALAVADNTGRMAVARRVESFRGARHREVAARDP